MLHTKYSFFLLPFTPFFQLSITISEIPLWAGNKSVNVDLRDSAILSAFFFVRPIIFNFLTLESHLTQSKRKENKKSKFQAFYLLLHPIVTHHSQNAKFNWRLKGRYYRATNFSTWCTDAFLHHYAMHWHCLTQSEKEKKNCRKQANESIEVGYVE